jgi:hypothetical protein
MPTFKRALLALAIIGGVLIVTAAAAMAATASGGTMPYEAGIAVGPVIADRPPHRSGRARFRHPAPILSV